MTRKFNDHDIFDKALILMEVGDKTTQQAIRENYNALTLRMKGEWSVEFRAYDDGIAYRYAETLLIDIICNPGVASPVAGSMR